MARDNKPWTKEEAAKLFDYATRGLSWSQIAAYLPGRTRNMVMSYCRRRGILKPRARQGSVINGKRRRAPNPPSKLNLFFSKTPLPSRLNTEKVDQLVTVLPGKPVAFADLNLDTQCRYPYEIGFCCGRPQYRKGYCKEHADRCYAGFEALEDA